jgi:peptidoglycan/xylan/chitin deacetylase (PgdA/CDA1 family)
MVLRSFIVLPVIILALTVSGARAQIAPAAPPVPGATAQPAVPVEPAASPKPDAHSSPFKADNAPATYSSAHVDGPYIAMTFDDGPSPVTTPILLDLLKQRNIKATFFLIGQNAEQYPDIVRRIQADGHEIGNHSWTHPQLSKLSDDRVSQEIQKTQDVIKSETGAAPTLLRPPYGAITKRQREWIEQKYGLNIILWSVDPFDWKRPGGSVIEQRILSGARPGAIILSHDIHKQTVEAMPATLQALAAKGFKFVTVSQLLAMNKPGTPVGASAKGTEKSAAEDSTATVPAGKSSGSNPRTVETRSQ